ncbi:MAG TPA: DUF308 domain-containing protein [Streptosporangiaceae bacterium]|nr:DUF308 domain-containing protein [Streptosporangiaceae bacterium]
MATSHATPTPPHPRPGEDGPEAAGERLDTAVQSDATPAAAQDGVPGGFGVLATWGFRPWVALYTAGAATFLLGLIVLIWPRATLVVLAILFGIYLVISGVLSLIEGMSERRSDGAIRIAYIVLGVLGVLLGLFCLRRIDVTVLLLAFMLSMFWITRGIVDLAIATSHDVQYKGLRAFTGVLSLVAGVLVLFWPGITLTALLIFAGIWLLIHGLTLAYLGYVLHRAARQAGSSSSGSASGIG